MTTVPANRADLNVLIVDDESLFQRLIKSTLGFMSVHKITIAADGKEGLQAVQANEQAGNPFNVLIVDWDMPVMDGIQFVEAFRKTDKAAVVIMVTARTSAADFNEAKRKGADYFFMKPLDPAMLKLRLGAAIDAALKNR
ncbi:MAG: response regulator [Rhodospirillales bacterium]|jgi:CheY-like chemotaxis protein|nr:response regulator [Rhodospirillales bacterium]MBT4040437.1 response regulator [Rhodospirillales bacterium]MBT4625955.1 response regulator [Rhodospirillales bacterium]MBT5350690.1 response regulator [Rhodospirillales bacterium]MBT5522052.1 response regulator [Rhodospirillales bacterium]